MITRSAIFRESVSLELAKIKAIINSASKSEILLSEFFTKSKHSSIASFCEFFLHFSRLLKIPQNINLSDARMASLYVSSNFLFLTPDTLHPRHRISQP